MFFRALNVQQPEVNGPRPKQLGCKLRSGAELVPACGGDSRLGMLGVGFVVCVLFQNLTHFA